jgi:hypothetical protein
MRFAAELPALPGNISWARGALLDVQKKDALSCACVATVMLAQDCFLAAT